MARKKTTKPGKKVEGESNARPWQLGDRVAFRYSELTGQIIELRGALGPGGAEIYGVQVDRDPEPTYIEVRGDQMVLLPAEA